MLITRAHIAFDPGGAGGTTAVTAPDADFTPDDMNKIFGTPDAHAAAEPAKTEPVAGAAAPSAAAAAAAPNAAGAPLASITEIAASH